MFDRKFKCKNIKSRRILRIFLAAALILAFAFSAVFAESLVTDFNKINISLNETMVAVSGENFSRIGWDGRTYTTPYSILYNGTTYLPIAKVAEFVGREVGWDAETRTVSIDNPAEPLPPPAASTAEPGLHERVTADMTLNSLTIKVCGRVFAVPGDEFSRIGWDGQIYTTPYSILYNGTTYLPLAKVSEILGKNVAWDAELYIASITDRPALSVYTNTSIPNYGALSGLPKAPESNEDDKMVYNYYVYTKTSAEDRFGTDLESYRGYLFDSGFVYKFSDTRVLEGAVNPTTLECYGNAAGELVVIGRVDYDGLKEVVVSYAK